MVLKNTRERTVHSETKREQLVRAREGTRQVTEGWRQKAGDGRLVTEGTGDRRHRGHSFVRRMAKKATKAGAGWKAGDRKAGDEG